MIFESKNKSRALNSAALHPPHHMTAMRFWPSKKKGDLVIYDDTKVNRLKIQKYFDKLN
jgi:hypothetical protein